MEKPTLRRDLKEYGAGDDGVDPTVVLRDPVDDSYYRLTAHEYHLLKALNGDTDMGSVLEKLRTQGRHYHPGEAQEIVAKAAQLGLLQRAPDASPPAPATSENADPFSALGKLYFLYIPLVNPDRFLTKTLPVYQALVNKWTGAIMALLAPAGIYFMITGIFALDQEYLFFFNTWNLLYLWAAVAGVKLAHEAAHAYCAKSFGANVPRMGVVFLIFFPCLYCDTTNAWLLTDRRRRIAVSAAGIVAEAALAVISAYIWYFCRPGIVKSLAYHLMAISFASTLFINANPLMKFDGYFILSDLLDKPNLAPNSLAWLRYLFLNRLLGIERVKAPSGADRDWFIYLTYGVASFMYRVFLYVFIVIGVYYRFDKHVGIMLALPAAGLFLVRPVIRGTKSLNRLRGDIRIKTRTVLILSVITALSLGILFIPLSSKTVYPCRLESAETRKLTIPLRTSVSKVFIREGQTVGAGELLFSLDPALLQLELDKKEPAKEIIKLEIQLMLLDIKEIGNVDRKLIELAQLGHEKSILEKDFRTAHEGIIAPFPAAVVRLDRRLKPGFLPGEGAIVGEIASVTDCEVRMLVPEDEIHKTWIGAAVEIWFPAKSDTVFREKITDMRPQSEKDLKTSPFSSRFGGEIAVESDSGRNTDAPLTAQYVCAVRFPHDTGLRLGVTGLCSVSAPPQSLFSRARAGIARTVNQDFQR